MREEQADGTPGKAIVRRTTAEDRLRGWVEKTYLEQSFPCSDVVRSGTCGSSKNLPDKGRSLLLAGEGCGRRDRMSERDEGQKPMLEEAHGGCGLCLGSRHRPFAVVYCQERVGMGLAEKKGEGGGSRGGSEEKAGEDQTRRGRGFFLGPLAAGPSHFFPVVSLSSWP